MNGVRSTGELRNAIVSAARTEFAQYGLAGARIDRIAKSAAASKERLYAHFRDKEALFREVVADDVAQFFTAVTVSPDAVAEFVGDIFDLARSHPEHFRMVNWARLEGISLFGPSAAEVPNVPEDATAVIKAAQRAGNVDPAWEPDDLLVLLFGLGLAWAYWPDPRVTSQARQDAGRRRAAAVEAAARVIAPRPSRNSR